MDSSAGPEVAALRSYKTITLKIKADGAQNHHFPHGAHKTLLGIESSR